MKKLFLLIFTVISAVVTNAQTIDFTYQGWSTQSGKNNLSLYIARTGFNLGSAFNDENYPVWYKENQEIDIVSGVINYRLTDISLDSLAKYRGELYLYVAINGTPHDTIAMDPSPYAGHSLASFVANRAARANYADSARASAVSDSATHSQVSDSASTAELAYRALSALRAARADTARYAVNANQATQSDVALYASSSAHAVWSDSAKYALNAAQAARATLAENALTADVADSAVNAAHAVHANTADIAAVADSAYVATNAHFVYANGVNLASIAASGAQSGSTLTTDGTSLTWRSSTTVEGNIQLTLVPLTTINNDTRIVIYRVAQNINSPLPAATDGRVVTIVNSSTANTVTVQAGVWNIWGGDVVIGPRNSATLLYHNGQWVVIAQ